MSISKEALAESWWNKKQALLNWKKVVPSWITFVAIN